MKNHKVHVIVEVLGDYGEMEANTKIFDNDAIKKAIKKAFKKMEEHDAEVRVLAIEDYEENNRGMWVDNCGNPQRYE